MNNRFKFRVWWKSPYTNVSSKYLYYDPQGNNYRTDIIRDANCDFAEDIIYYDLRDIILGNIDEYERSDTFTVEQCTGLKDKNGNLIYEGDIIKDRGDIQYQIKWKDAGFFAVAMNEFNYMPDCILVQQWLNTWKAEIISNIHEQAEQKDK